MTSKAISDLIALEPLFSQLPRSPIGRPNRNADVLVTRDQAKTILAAISALKSLPVDGRREGLEMEQKGQNLLDALMVRFPDLKEPPDMIHSTDIGKGLLKAIREFHLAWADFGALRILAMSDDEAIRSLIASPHEVVPSGPSESHVEAAAKVLADWIGYDWEGLGDRDISPEYPDWAYNGIGDLGMQGGKPALRKVVLAMLSAARFAPAVKADEAMVEVPKQLIQNISKAGQALLDALMMRFPDMRDYPGMIHSTDIGKRLLKAIREFHLAWADLGVDEILKMTDGEALSAIEKPEGEG